MPTSFFFPQLYPSLPLMPLIFCPYTISLAERFVPVVSTALTNDDLHAALQELNTVIKSGKLMYNNW
jgi:hypothetical protein